MTRHRARTPKGWIRAARRRVAAAALLGASAAAAALAQGADTLAPPDDFEEFFVGGSPAAGLFAPAPQSDMGAVGRVLVGLSLGRPSAERRLDLAALRVAPPDGPGGRLCVWLTTTDGRFSARSDHPLAASYAEPPRLGLTTAYADALAGYSEAEVLVHAVRAKTCSAEAVGIAAPLSASTEAKELIASVNLGRGRPKAWLERDGAPATEKVRCRKDEQVAKTHDCAIPLSGLAAGGYALVVDSSRLDGPSLIERTAIVLR